MQGNSTYRTVSKKQVCEWKSFLVGERSTVPTFTCLKCAGSSLRGDDDAPEESIWCVDCKQPWPARHFDDLSLTKLKHTEELEQLARCVRCERERRDPDSLNEKLRCYGCHLDKELREYAPIVIKNLGLRGGFHKCEACQFPTCANCDLKASKDEDYERTPRPTHPPTQTCFHDGKYYCLPCRYPTCTECEMPRPQSNGEYRREFSVFLKPNWNLTSTFASNRIFSRN